MNDALPPVNPRTVASRLRRGWSIDRATTVANGRRDNVRSRYVEAYGERLIVSDWARRFGVGVPTILRRLDSGWPAERAVSEPDARVVHSHSPRGRPSPEYRVWASMIQRCTNPSTSAYAYYGARGVRVCDEWLQSFEAFLADVGPRPPGASLDRIDGAGHYEPGNVRWATPQEQRDNARNTHRITFRGETRTRAEWARHLGIPYFTLRGRLDSGWSVEDAFTRPKFWRKS